MKEGVDVTGKTKIATWLQNKVPLLRPSPCAL